MPIVDLPSHRGLVRPPPLWTPGGYERARRGRMRIEAAAPTIVGTDINAHTGNVSSLGQAMSLANVAGGTIVVFTNWYDNTAVPAASNPMTDTSGNTYTLLGHNYSTFSSPNSAINAWVATGIKAAGAGANTVTAAWNVAATSPTVAVVQVTKSLVDNATVLFGNGGASTSNPTSTGPVTTTYAHELFLLYCWTEGTISAVGSGWTSLLSGSPDANGNGGEYLSDSGALGASVTGTISQTLNEFWTQGMLGLYTPAASTFTTDVPRFSGGY